MTHAELSRLDKLTRELRTVDDVLAAFGQPDRDLNPGSGMGERAADGAPIFEWCRTLVYQHLSESIEVHALERPNGEIRFSFSGKPIDSVNVKSDDDDSKEEEP